jgi:hypothetical protein
MCSIGHTFSWLSQTLFFVIYILCALSLSLCCIEYIIPYVCYHTVYMVARLGWHSYHLCAHRSDHQFRCELWSWTRAGNITEQGRAYWNTHTHTQLSPSIFIYPCLYLWLWCVLVHLTPPPQHVKTICVVVKNSYERISRPVLDQTTTILVSVAMQMIRSTPLWMLHQEDANSREPIRTGLVMGCDLPPCLRSCTLPSLVSPSPHKYIYITCVGVIV